MGRKSSGASGIIIGSLIVLGLLAEVIEKYWPILLILGGLAFIFWLFSQMRQSSSNTISSSLRDAGIRTQFMPTTQKPLIQDGDQLWLPAGKSSTVAGYVLDGGFLYVGKRLAAAQSYGIEAALIDPSLPVNKSEADYTERQLNYWPSYTDASPEARAAYLNWLASGRSDPRADIGYVFLYYYGLERRALADVTQSTAARAELPQIINELQRLVSIYGENHSFYRYATSLLNQLNMDDDFSSCDSPPPLSPAGELTFKHRLCLGQLSASSTPLSGEWAFLWLMGDPNTRLKTPAKRCPDEFKRAFLAQYADKYGAGIVLPQNKTRLKVSYHPASPSLRHSNKLEKSLDLPDVTVLSSPLKKLNAIAEACIARLESYSRFLGRNPDKSDSADAMLELPFSLWPDKYRKPIEQLSVTIRKAGKPMATNFARLQALFPDWHDINRQRYQSLSRALSEIGMGIEPDIKFGGKLPTSDTIVVLFSDDNIDTYREPSSEYGAAALTLHLAVAVSAADGDVGEDERQLLLRQLEDWLHLHNSARCRLQAHLRWLMSDPPGLGSLKKRIDALSMNARQAIGEFLTVVAKADNEVTPEEVKLLEKIFKMLGLDVQSVYAMLHVETDSPVTIRPPTQKSSGYTIPKPPQPKDTGLEIDMDRVAALHAESEKVNAILGAIFVDETIPPEPEPEPTDIDPDVDDSVMGLDSDHTALTRLLLTRQEWNREELEELALDRGMMLDGALERINEAAFDAFDQPFSEGDDPVEINQEVAKEVSQ